MTSSRLPLTVRAWLLSAAMLVCAALQGCASAPNAHPRDPWEPFNRQVSSFNESVDEAVVKPVATAYQHVTPELVRTGVSNFFGNLSDVWSLVNNVLQLKPRESVETLFRVGVNTTIGLAGLIDVATELHLEKHREDFGQTLGYWGVPTGPYLVLPLLGPSTLRDTVALPVDRQGNVVSGLDDVATRNSLTALRLVDLRASLLGAGRLMENAAIDKYTFTRDVYLQRRRGLVREEAEPQSYPAEERYDLPEPDKSAAPAGASPTKP